MFAVETVNDLWDHIAYVLMYAPNSFPKEDFLSGSEQMSLELAFDLLKAGVFVAYPEDECILKRSFLYEILKESYDLYNQGYDIKAGLLLNKFEEQIFRDIR